MTKKNYEEDVGMVKVLQYIAVFFFSLFFFSFQFCDVGQVGIILKYI
jgi:hypothetical protein